jgi:hypothetical protein
MIQMVDNTDKNYPLTLLQISLQNAVGSLSTVLRCVNLSLDNFDTRRQLLIECVYKELCKHMSDLIVVILENSMDKFDIHHFLDECLFPDEVPENCRLQQLFIKLFKVNAEKSLTELNNILNSNISERNANINKIFRYFHLIMEDIYISASAIDMSCLQFKNVCDCNQTELCSCDERHDNLILYYTAESKPFNLILNDYINIGKDMLDSSVNLVIDFSILNSSIINNQSSIKEYIFTDKDYNALVDAENCFRKVLLKNTRFNTIKFQDNIRDQIHKNDHILFV